MNEKVKGAQNPKETATEQQISALARAAWTRTVERPKGGWLRAARAMLGLTTGQAGQKMNKTRQNVAYFERAEFNEKIVLATFRECAAALGFDLVYHLVPVEDAARERLHLLSTGTELSLRVMKAQMYFDDVVNISYTASSLQNELEALVNRMTSAFQRLRELEGEASEQGEDTERQYIRRLLAKLEGVDEGTSKQKRRASKSKSVAADDVPTSVT